jgi:hypothetical protein
VADEWFLNPSQDVQSNPRPIRPGVFLLGFFFLRSFPAPCSTFGGSNKKSSINLHSTSLVHMPEVPATHKSLKFLRHRILKIAQVAGRSRLPKGKRGDDLHSVVRQLRMNREKGAYGDGYAGRPKAFPPRKSGAAFARSAFSAWRRMNYLGTVPLHERRTINVTERQIL